LIEALDDPSLEVRQEAVAALARIGDAESVEPLVRTLRSPESGIQTQAAFALGKLRDPRAVDALLEALKEPYLAQSAATALGEIGERSAIEPLLAVLPRRDISEATRASVANALSRMGEASALPEMLAALQSTQSLLVRREMALAIGNLFGRPGEFYRLLTLERQVAGQEITRLQDQIVRDSVRFKSNPQLIQQVLRQMEQAHAGYNREQWREACEGYARAGLLLAGSLPGEQGVDGMFNFLTEWFQPHRRKMEALAQRDGGSGPLWFLLAITYPQSQEKIASAHEESLLSFYAFWRIWDAKAGHRGI
jgi:hypothetical protein